MTITFEQTGLPNRPLFVEALDFMNAHRSEKATRMAELLDKTSDQMLMDLRVKASRLLVDKVPDSVAAYTLVEGRLEEDPFAITELSKELREVAKEAKDVQDRYLQHIENTSISVTDLIEERSKKDFARAILTEEVAPNFEINDDYCMAWQAGTTVAYDLVSSLNTDNPVENELAQILFQMFAIADGIVDGKNTLLTQGMNDAKAAAMQNLGLKDLQLDAVM